MLVASDEAPPVRPASTEVTILASVKAAMGVNAVDFTEEKPFNDTTTKIISFSLQTPLTHTLDLSHLIQAVRTVNMSPFQLLVNGDNHRISIYFKPPAAAVVDVVEP